jgi:hypothetical protein
VPGTASDDTRPILKWWQETYVQRFEAEVCFVLFRALDPFNPNGHKHGVMKNIV